MKLLKFQPHNFFTAATCHSFNAPAYVSHLFARAMKRPSFLQFGALFAVIAYTCTRHLDLIVTLCPKYIDAYLVRALFSRKLTNTGATSLPRVTTIIPSDISMENLKDIISHNGYPVLVKNIMSPDQDRIVQTMFDGNGGREMRMLDYSTWKDPHFSSSCAFLQVSQSVPFDHFAKHHLFKNVSHNHSSLYAGFESITDVETINQITGLDIEKVGDYRLNNLFTSNFDREILTAPIHCAPIDSVTFQLVGTKTWFFVSPEELATLQNIPMPTAFTLPLTDDQLLSKLKNIYIIKQGPGDAMYFGPHWCHAVSTAPGPNLMLNMRYNAVPKLKKGPLSLVMKLFIRNFLRPYGGRPQDNLLAFPLIYQDLNSYYDNCGPSEAFNSIYNNVLKYVV